MINFEEKIGITQRETTRYGITIAIHNGARKGKTLTAVALTLYYLFKFKDIKGVLSNVKLYDIPKPYIPLADMKQISDRDFENYIILTDEFRSIIDSRMSSSYKNLFISNILRDTGKFKQIHILTDQDANSIDRRVRGNTDYVLHPTINLDTLICNVKVFGNPEQNESAYDTYYRARAYGLIDSWVDEFEYDMLPIFDHYNTGEKIEEYYITFTPEEYADEFIKWFKDKEYDKHNAFKIKKSTLVLWKQTEGVYISSEQMSALIEWLTYNTDYPIYGVKR